MIVVAGAVIMIIGLVMFLFPKMPLPGKLPGDIVIKREHFTFYLPLTTSIIVSIVISLILYLVRMFR